MYQIYKPTKIGKVDEQIVCSYCSVRLYLSVSFFWAVQPRLWICSKDFSMINEVGCWASVGS